MTDDTPSADTPSADQPSTDASGTDEPSADAPVTDEPSVNDPAQNEASEEKPDADNSSDEKEPVQDDQDTAGKQDPEESEDTDKPSADAAESGKETEKGSLTDSGSRVTVSGNFSKDASVIVSSVDPNTDAYTTYVSADPVKGKTILGVYDITLTGTMEGKAELTFHVGTDYNGKNVIILHYTGNGQYEKYTATVEDGRVTVSVDGFSPYVIALDETGSDTDTVRSPKTGDSADAVLWAALLGLSAAAAAFALLKKKSYR